MYCQGEFSPRDGTGCYRVYKFVGCAIYQHANRPQDVFTAPDVWGGFSGWVSGVSWFGMFWPGIHHKIVQISAFCDDDEKINSGLSKRSFWKTVVLSPAENRWF